jgi:hypothetical protein
VCTKRATTTSVPLATKAKKDIIQAMKLINDDVEDLTISLPPQVGAGGADEESATGATAARCIFFLMFLLSLYFTEETVY